MRTFCSVDHSPSSANTLFTDELDIDPMIRGRVPFIESSGIVSAQAADRSEVPADVLPLHAPPTHPISVVAFPFDVGVVGELLEVRARRGEVLGRLVAHLSVDRELFELRGDGRRQKVEVKKVVRDVSPAEVGHGWAIPEVGVDREPLEARGLGYHEA
eukprot:scaffold28911_cov62-Phaeocystis_antarctica.AAC.2